MGSGGEKGMTGVKRLPSGYWAVFVGGIWVDAACPSKEAAETKLAQFLQKMKGGAT
jgi:hypothetical protein